MLDFGGRSTCGFVMSSSVLLSLLLGVACHPNAERMHSGRGSGELKQLNSGEENAEGGRKVSPEDQVALQGTPISSMTSTKPPNAQMTPTGLRSVADWEKLFLAHWNIEHTNDYLPGSSSLDSWQFYN